MNDVYAAGSDLRIVWGSVPRQSPDDVMRAYTQIGMLNVLRGVNTPDVFHCWINNGYVCKRPTLHEGMEAVAAEARKRHAALMGKDMAKMNQNGLNLRPTHPGRTLEAELKSRSMTADQLADMIGVSRDTILGVISGELPIT